MQSWTRGLATPLVIATALYALPVRAVSVQIPYSGQLAENGELVNGNRNFTFRICRNTACAGADQLYTQTINNVAATNGAFSVSIGGTPALDSTVFKTAGLLLKVAVGATTLGDVALPFSPYSADTPDAVLRDGSRSMTGTLNGTSADFSGTLEAGATTVTTLTGTSADFSGTLEAGATTVTTLTGTSADFSGTLEAGATTVTTLTADATTVDSLNVTNGGITNAGAISGATSISAASVSTTGGVTVGGTLTAPNLSVTTSLSVSALSSTDNVMVTLDSDNNGTSSLQVRNGGGTTVHSIGEDGALDTAGGITAGSGNVAIADATGKLPALNATNYSSLDGGALVNLDADNFATGTVPLARLSGITTAQLSATAGITSGQVADGAITNADINGSAGIVDTKLATITTAGKVADSALSANVSLLGSSISSAEIDNATIVAADISATAGITGSQLAAAAGIVSGQITDGTIVSADIADGTVSSTDIANGTIVDADISATANIDVSKLTGLGNLATLNSVSSAEITNGTIVSADISGTANITGSQLAAAAGITGSQLAAAAGIVSGQITDGTIISADIADGTVSSTDIADATITNTDIAGGATIVDTKLATITTAGKVADTALSANVSLLGSSITSGEITDGTITTTDINGSAGITGGQLSATAGILGSQLSATAGILGSQLAAAAGIVSGQITDGTITSTDIADGTIVAVDLSGSLGISSGQITDGTIVSADINGSAGITNGQLANSSLTVTAGNALSGGGAISLGGSATLDVATGAGLEISTDTVRISTAAAGNGLTGGGGSALAVGAGTGITVIADSVGISAGGVTETQLANSVAGNGLTGGGGSALAVGAGTGITVIADSVGISNNGVTETQLATSVAGNGLTGGGGTALAVGGGNGIGVTANNVDLAALTANWSQTGAFDIVLGNSASELQIQESTGTNMATVDVADLSTAGTYTLAADGGGDIVVTNSDVLAAVNTTPNVRGVTVLVLGGFGTAQNLTALSNAVPGQCVVVIGGTNTVAPTINDTGNFTLSANWTAAEDATLSLCTVDGTEWHETSRSTN